MSTMIQEAGLPMKKDAVRARTVAETKKNVNGLCSTIGKVSAPASSRLPVPSPPPAR